MADGVAQVLAAQGAARLPLLAVGVGAFLADDVARVVGLDLLEEAARGPLDPVAFPACAVAVVAGRAFGLVERWT